MSSEKDQAIDVAKVQDRYRQEREKRLRPDAWEQYVHIEGALSEFLVDPQTGSVPKRAALTDEVDVLVIGGGFGGLLTAARLRQSGVGSVRIIDKAGDFGGTWYWNRYPGAACDIESYIYLPLLEELGYVPTLKYARQPEILAYSRALAEHFGLYGNAYFQTEVVRMHWDSNRLRWIVETDRADAIAARFVCMANGNPLHKPKLPGVPGIRTFKGRAFHTSRWDYAYTGGDENGALTGLSDKRVGLIGTGATAVQIVPHLGRWSGHLSVFQRTPSSIDVRNNQPTRPNWSEMLQPGWQQRRRENFTALVSGGVQDEDLVDDGWTQGYWRALLSRETDDPAEFTTLLEASDLRKMEDIRHRVSEVIADPVTAGSLKPWYRRLCKRPCFHDDYLTTFNRPNVTLVDTQGRGVERITETGVVANGQAYPLDCLIYATGFEFGTDLAKRIGYPVIGIGGQSLKDKWADGAATLHGMLSRGFPNCLIINGLAQAGVTPNLTHMLDEQAKHAAYVIATALERGVHQLEPSKAAEQAWVDEIVRLAEPRRESLADCTPGYLNNEGRPEAMNLKNSFYAGGALNYIQILAAWRAANNWPGIDFH